MFGDLVGSTALQESLDPETAQRVMARFYATMRQVITRHGGQLDKFVGDGVVAVFGVPAVAEDDALRAVRCAADMIGELDALSEDFQRGWRIRLRMRVGVNTGELVVSGDGELVGDAMNTAARLEQAAAPGEVLIGQDTRRLVRDDVQLEPVPPLALKGKTNPVPAWRVLAGKPAAERARAEAPLVGRAGELTRLRGVLDEASRERVCRLVTVIGSPGMGKSRLAEEFRLSLGEDVTGVLGRCEPFGEGITFGPVAELLRAAAGIGDAESPDVVRAKLAALVAGEADAERICARAGSLLGVADPASVQETFWGVRRVLEALARRRPLVVVLEDVHWAQPLLLDLIEHLAEWVRDVAMLLLVLSRPELRETREALTTPGRRVTEVIELVPLGGGESRVFVTGVLGQSQLPADLLERILDTTEGNPLFLGETLRMLVDDGSLTKQGEMWVPAGNAAEVAVPPTIHALLSARIERLRGEERAVVERASVIGKQFYRGAVAELVAPPVRAGLDGHLDTLRRKEMVEPDGTYWVDEPVYRFHHVLLRDAAYRSLLKEARAELHERFADWLATKAGELVGEHEEVIAYHLEQAHEYRRQLGALDDAGHALGARAAAMLASAGRRALARADTAAAANLLGRACARAETDEPELLWDWAEAVLDIGDTTTGADVVARLAATGRQARADVLAGQLAILTEVEPPEAVVERLSTAAEAMARDGDHVGATVAHRLGAQALGSLGRLGAAEAELDKALVEARRAGDRRRITAALAAAPRTALWGPSPVVRSSGRCLDVLRILRMNPGNRHVEAATLRCQAVLEAVRGRFAPARQILDSARVTLKELGLSTELHELGTYAGMIELLAGDPSAAETHFRAAHDGFAALDVGPGAAQAAALLARALLDQGRDPEAIEQTQFAEQHAGGHLKTTITAFGARAEALARTRDADEALELALRAVSLAEPTDALPDKADAAMALARVLRTLGRPDESRAAASQALELYRAKDHTIGITRATELAGAGTVAPQPAAAPQQPASGVLGDRQPERVVAEWLRRFPSRDIRQISEMFSTDCRGFDHRRLGWGEVTGRAGLDELNRSVFATTGDVRFEPVEVLACDDRAIACTLSFAARAIADDGGGEAEFPVGFVAAIDHGLIISWDQYDPDDRRAMIARYVELGGGQGPLGDRPPEQVVRQTIRRFAQRELRSAFDQLWGEDIVLVDHRQLGWGESDKAGYLTVLQSMFDSAMDVRFEVDEVLACDARVVVYVGAFRGHSADGGGVFEISNGVVILVEDGRMRRIERFEPDDRAGMLARYAELGGRRDVLGDRPTERVIADYLHRWNGRSLDEVVALAAEDIVRVDHRKLGWEEVRGLDGMREHFRSEMEFSADARLDVDEVLACDDRVIVFRESVRGTTSEGGGTFETVFGVVALIENGLFTSVDLYEPDDRQTMIARYVELRGGHGSLGDRPPEQVFREGLCRWARQDFDGFEQLYADDLIIVDHRKLGWTQTDKQSDREVAESLWAASLDVRVDVDEVLARDDRFLAMLIAFRGHGVDSGGEFEIASGLVLEIVNGRIRRMERCEYNDRDAILARYTELGGHCDVLGDRPPERVIAEYVDRIGTRELDQAVAFFDEDIVLVDHRKLGWGEWRGSDDVWGHIGSALREWLDARIEFDEVLACDDRVIAFRARVRGTAAEEGGTYQVTFGVVALVENAMTTRLDLYEADDRQTMIARYVELGGGHGLFGDRPPERAIREMLRTWARRDLDRYLELLTDDFVMVDHRQLGWSESDKAGYRTVLQSMLDAAVDVRNEIDEVLACDERVLALLMASRGTSVDGGGPFEIAVGAVYVVEDGRVRRLERYDYDDRDAMLVRYAELAGRGAVLGDRPPERVAARLCRRWTAADMETLIGLFTDDVVRVDHRTLGYDEAYGRDGLRETYTAMLGMSSEVCIDPEEVLACDERVLVLLATLRGTAAEGGGEHATPCGYLFVVAEDRIQRLEQFEPAERQAMIARYTELGGGLGPLRGQPLEWFGIEYVRRASRRDLDGFLELLADDYIMIDHQRLGWPETDKAGQRTLFETWLAASLDARFEIDEVLGCDERVLAYVGAVRGHSVDGGGAYEIANTTVCVLENDLLRAVDMYAPEDREAALDRYAELTGGRPTALGDHPAERVLADLCRRWEARDAAGVAELYSDDFVDVEHRRLGWDDTGKGNLTSRIESFFASSGAFRFDIDEVLARDDRVVAFEQVVRGTNVDGGGLFEIAYGVVTVVEGGLIHRVERYEPDDRQAMIARFVELGGGLGPLGDRPPEQHLAQVCRCLAARDLDGMTGLYADDYRVVDHRKLGWQDTEKVHVPAFYESWFTVGSKLWFEVDEVLACDDRLFALTCTTHGMAIDGGGTFEIQVGSVALHDKGRRCEEHVYPPEDRQGMLAKFAELGGGQAALGDRPPERFVREWCRRVATGEPDRMAELYAKEFRRVDHRMLAWEETGHTDQRRHFESFFTTGCDLWARIVEVVACDDRVIALTWIMHGRHRDGRGTFEIRVDDVMVIENGLLHCTDMYGPNDRDAMLARFAELTEQG